MADTPTHFIVHHILTGETKELAIGANCTSWYTVNYTDINSDISKAKASVLEERDSLLAATDWTANSDVTMSDEMRAYRQALRDVPSQAGFPDDVTWPVKPE